MELGNTKLEVKMIQQARVQRIMRSLRTVWTSIRRRGRAETLCLSEPERRQLLLSFFEQYQAEIANKSLQPILLVSFAISLVLLVLSPLVGIPCLLVALAVTGNSVLSWCAVESAGKSLLSLSQDSLDVTLVPSLLEYARRRSGMTGSYRDRIEILALYLRQLLPQVSPEAAEQWTLDQREALSDILTAPFVDFDLTVAVLRVIAFAGARSALPRVQFLAGLPEYRITSAAGKSRKVNRKNARWIRAAAQDCLPMLMDRYASLEAPETLLRSSVLSGEDESRHLLRIADNGLVKDERELLRPQSLQKQDPPGQTGAHCFGYDFVPEPQATTAQECLRVGSKSESNEASR